VSGIRTLTQGDDEMRTFEAYVRIQDTAYIIKTTIRADNSQAAYFLLQGQYGKDNVVHFPREV
jgi:hypothetical protein